MSEYTDSLEYFMTKVEIGGNPWLCWGWKAAADKDGYGVHSLNGKYVRAHIASYLLHGGSIPPGYYILHSCDVQACCNPKHLRTGTPKENSVEMAAKGRGTHGEKNNTTKLTLREAWQIRDLCRAGPYSQTEIAKLYGVEKSAVSRIKLYKTWWVDISPYN